MNRVISIGDRLVGDCQPCFIIAEAGVNHNGNMDLAFKLIEKALELKGILTFSEDCWLNNLNKLENINTNSNTKENKDKYINNSEIRYSITTNDSNILNAYWFRLGRKICSIMRV